MKANANTSSSLNTSKSQHTTKKESIALSQYRALAHCKIENIQEMNENELIKLQRILGHGEIYGYWATPREWCKSQSGEATLNINIRKRIEHFLPKELQAIIHESNLKSNASIIIDKLVELAVTIQTRYQILLRMAPSALGRKKHGKALDPNTIKVIAYSHVPQIFALCIAKYYKSHAQKYENLDNFPKHLLSLLEDSDFNTLSKSGKRNALQEIARMHWLFVQGYWNDNANVSNALNVITKVRGEKAPKLSERDVNPHLPFPDDYVSEMGYKSLWLINHLAPNILELGEQLLSIWPETEDISLAEYTVCRNRKRLIGTLLENHVWKDSTGQIFNTPPFKIKLTQHGKKNDQNRGDQFLPRSSDSATVERKTESSIEEVHWPPRTFGELMALMGTVQSAHLFVVSMSMAARRSECLDMNRNCVRYERNGFPYANARTFKLVEEHDGQFRDWILPDIAVLAIEQQVRLVRCMERIGRITPDRSQSPLAQEPEHLWGQYGVGKSDRTKPLLGLNQALTAYAKTLFMDPCPGGQNIRHHRFRKTIARLAGLAITQAPKVLMDVFGHESIEMTLYYILADKDLRAEIEKVSRELRVIRATQVIEEMVAEEENINSFGGPAANIFKEAVLKHKRRVYQTEKNWGANNVADLAEILTLQGKAWQYVRPGIICTKFPGTESGPCNKSKGHPEPSRCQSHCNHRLEEPFLREDVHGAIRDCLDEYTNADARNDELILEFWAAQIRNHMSRFADIRREWLKNPIIARICDWKEFQE